MLLTDLSCQIRLWPSWAVTLPCEAIRANAFRLLKPPCEIIRLAAIV